MFAQRLRSARKAKKLTQEELANLVGTTKTTISNYETGYSTPSFEILLDIANVLDVTTDYLLGRADESKSATNNNDIFSNIQKTKELKDFLGTPSITYNGIPLTEKDKEKINMILQALFLDRRK